MIYEITGQPGHGKTLYGLSLARDFKAKGREVYVTGVRDLDYNKTGFLKLEKPEEWEKLPDGSVVMIDECYTVFPNRNASSAVPPFIEALARHRHRGFDFILIHQQPNQVDPFVRGLVDTHHHVRRKFGFNAAVIKTWDYSTPSPIKDTPLRAPVWKYDKSIYELYTSATMHTVKRTIPWQLYIVVPVLGFVLWVGWRLTSGAMAEDIAGEAKPTAAGATAQAGVPAAGGLSTFGKRSPVYSSPEEYANAHTPRIATLPWSAPVFDQRGVQSHPEVFCASSKAGLDANGDHKPASCSCLTEQGTPYGLTDAECRMVARQGMPYNPYRRDKPPIGEGGGARPSTAMPASAGAPSPGAVIDADQVSGYGGFGPDTGKAAPG